MPVRPATPARTDLERGLQNGVDEETIRLAILLRQAARDGSTTRAHELIDAIADAGMRGLASAGSGLNQIIARILAKYEIDRDPTSVTSTETEFSQKDRAALTGVVRGSEGVPARGSGSGPLLDYFIRGDREKTVHSKSDDPEDYTSQEIGAATEFVLTMMEQSLFDPAEHLAAIRSDIQYATAPADV